MKDRIEQRALELGFDVCRFTSAEPPASALHFQHWVDSSHHGEMAYLARNAHKRVDPQLVLPGVRSVVTLAAAYSCDTKRLAKGNEFSVSGIQSPVGATIAKPNTEDSARKTGVIARYARYADYHDILAGPLKQLVRFIDDLGGPATRSLWYVDTGPVLERDLAQRAGLGFVGKHTNLISRRLGNWFFLAEILTTLELPSDPPEKNRCGSCTRCIECCPTQAITAPFQLDARRCISYLTIELKGSIPVELRPAIGNRIYGCDDCLEVCPWNRFAGEGRLMKQHARRELETPDLLEILSLDETGFRRRFAGTPMLRTKRRGLLRNVCVALGNVGDSTALSALDRAARDREPLVAEHAAWARAQIADRE